MAETDHTQEAAQTITETVKGMLSKVTWKHALIVAASLGIIIYPQPLMRLFVPVIAKISPNQLKKGQKRTLK